MYTPAEFSILLAEKGFLLIPPCMVHDRDTMDEYKPNLSLSLTQFLVFDITVYEEHATALLNYVGSEYALPNIPLNQDFDLYTYLRLGFEDKKISSARFEISWELESWLSVYAKGYTFMNYLKGVAADRECSFCLTINHNLLTEDKFMHKNEVVKLHYEVGIDRVDISLSFSLTANYGRIAAINFTRFTSLEEFLDTCLKDVNQVMIYRRKQILDTVLKDVL